MFSKCAVSASALMVLSAFSSTMASPPVMTAGEVVDVVRRGHDGRHPSSLGGTLPSYKASTTSAPWILEWSQNLDGEKLESINRQNSQLISSLLHSAEQRRAPATVISPLELSKNTEDEPSMSFQKQYISYINDLMHAVSSPRTLATAMDSATDITKATSIAAPETGSPQRSSTESAQQTSAMGTTKEKHCDKIAQAALNACLEQVNWHCLDQTCSCEISKARNNCFEENCEKDDRHAEYKTHMEKMCSDDRASVSLTEIQPETIRSTFVFKPKQTEVEVHRSKNGTQISGHITKVWRERVAETIYVFGRGIGEKTVWTDKSGQTHIPVVKEDAKGNYITYNERYAEDRSGSGLRAGITRPRPGNGMAHGNAASMSLPGISAILIGALGLLTVAL